jgi:hypothetical protein
MDFRSNCGEASKEILRIIKIDMYISKKTIFDHLGGIILYVIMESDAKKNSFCPITLVPLT